MQQSNPADGFFRILAQHGYDRVNSTTVRKGFIEIALRCYPPAFEIVVELAHRYTWLSPKSRLVNPILTRPREAARMAMELGSILLAELQRGQDTLTLAMKRPHALQVSLPQF